MLLLGVGGLFSVYLSPLKIAMYQGAAASSTRNWDFFFLERPNMTDKYFCQSLLFYCYNQM